MRKPMRKPYWLEKRERERRADWIHGLLLGGAIMLSMLAMLTLAVLDSPYMRH